MINKFGKVMVYVNDPEVVSDFWCDKIGFKKVKQQEQDNKVLSIELEPNEISDCHLVLFNRTIIEKFSLGISLENPSILFGSYDIDEMRKDLIAKNVVVGELVDHMDRRTFNFSDCEGNYYAVEEITK